MPLPRVFTDLRQSSGAKDEQNKTNTFGCRNTAGGPHCFFLAVDGAISHLYNRLQSAMVQGFLK
jgi:hypothetical protein